MGWDGDRIGMGIGTRAGWDGNRNADGNRNRNGDGGRAVGAKSQFPPQAGSGAGLCVTFMGFFFTLAPQGGDPWQIPVWGRLLPAAPRCFWHCDPKSGTWGPPAAPSLPSAGEKKPTTCSGGGAAATTPHSSHPTKAGPRWPRAAEDLWGLGLRIWGLGFGI